MNAEDANQIDVEHTPSVVYGLGGATTWVCACGSWWPCRQLQLADDARQQRARIARAQAAMPPNDRALIACKEATHAQSV